VGDGVEDVVGGGGAATDNYQFRKLPSVIEADGVGPRRVTIIFDDVHRMPTEVAYVRNHHALEVIGGEVFWILGHFSPFPLFCCCALPQG
jgi:hypothetical protein